MDKVIVTLTGPSGSGKSTLANRLIAEHGFKNVISHTTREPRAKEVDGKDYHFVSQQEFRKMLKEWRFVEHVSFNECFYGLSIEEINAIHESSSTPVIVVEPNGLRQISQYCNDNDIRLVSIFIGGELETLIKRVLYRDLVGVTITPNLVDYVSRRLTSLVHESNAWVSEFAYTRAYDMYDSSTEDMIVETILEEVYSGQS